MAKEKVKTTEVNFVDFADKARKKELEKDYKEILKNHPEIYEVIEREKKLQKDYEEIINECADLGEQKDEMERKFKIYEKYDIEQLIRTNKALTDKVKLIRNMLQDAEQRNLETVTNLNLELEKANKEIKKLSNSVEKKRNA